MRVLGIILALLMSSLHGWLASTQYTDEFGFWWCSFYTLVFMLVAWLFFKIERDDRRRRY